MHFSELMRIDYSQRRALRPEAIFGNRKPFENYVFILPLKAFFILKIFKFLS